MGTTGKSKKWAPNRCRGHSGGYLQRLGPPNHVSIPMIGHRNDITEYQVENFYGGLFRQSLRDFPNSPSTIWLRTSRFRDRKNHHPDRKNDEKYFWAWQSPRIGYTCLIYIFAKRKTLGDDQKVQKYFFTKKINASTHFPTRHAPGTRFGLAGGNWEKLQPKLPPYRFLLWRP